MSGLMLTPRRVPGGGVDEALVREDYAGPVSLRFGFTADVVPANVQLVIEDADEHTISVNGRAIEYAGLPHWLDRSFMPVDVAEAVVEGENVVEIAREFTAPARAGFELGGLFQTSTGVELEPIYVIGEFGVRTSVSAGEARPKCTRLAPEFALTTESGTFESDLTAEGYPFFVGRATLSTTIELAAPTDGERVVLTGPRPGAALAKVRVNGRDAGALAWAPFELDVTSFVRGGVNELEIELVTTLRNLLGPHHHPEGEPYRPNSNCWTGAPAGPDWHERRHEDDVPWTDDYFVLPLGPRGRLSVEYRAAE